MWAVVRVNSSVTLKLTGEMYSVVGDIMLKIEDSPLQAGQLLTKGHRTHIITSWS